MCPQVERIWDLILTNAEDIQSSAVSKLGPPAGPRRTLRHLDRSELKLALALQFMSKGRELRRLEKIGKEYEEFIADLLKHR